MKIKELEPELSQQKLEEDSDNKDEWRRLF